MPIFRTGSYESIHPCVGGVVFLYYQDSRYLMRLVEAVKEECPLGRGQMFQHCRSFRPAVLAGADEECCLLANMGVPVGCLPWAPTFL